MISILFSHQVKVSDLSSDDIVLFVSDFVDIGSGVQMRKLRNLKLTAATPRLNFD
jgi:hypothetical protein